VVGLEDAAMPLKKGNDMPKQSTTMKAKRISCCPLCLNVIPKGINIKVYSNSWYHPKCCDEIIRAIESKKKLKERNNYA
jgi:hypothetical protein|tara:strand:+ start:2628 stop:2864 length:237 start_codon:yes stop_codon:yes gene_type:complete